MENNDEWLALDKLYHILFGFLLTIIFSSLASRTPYSFIRRRPILVGSILSLLAGVAKEAADELGYFMSAGASSKDLVADVLGTLLAAISLSLCSSYTYRVGSDLSDQAVKALEMV